MFKGKYDWQLPHTSFVPFFIEDFSLLFMRLSPMVLRLSFLTACILMQTNPEHCKSREAGNDLPSLVDTEVGVVDSVLHSLNGAEKKFLEQNWVVCVVGSLPLTSQSLGGVGGSDKHQPQIKYSW